MHILILELTKYPFQQDTSILNSNMHKSDMSEKRCRAATVFTICFVEKMPFIFSILRVLRQLQLHRQLAASCAAAYVSYLLTREEMSTNARLATHTVVQYVAQIAVQLISCASASSAVAHDTTAYSSSLSENVGAVHTLKTAFTRNTASFVRGRNEIVR